MPKVRKKTKRRIIDSNISEAFKVIDAYLPYRYASLVVQKIPNVTEDNIRKVRARKGGNPLIIAALKEVAIENKKLINK